MKDAVRQPMAQSLNDPEAERAGVRRAAPLQAAALSLIETVGCADYELVDSGHGRKLERFGRFSVDRPEPQALWRQRLAPEAWLRADAAFKSDKTDEECEGGRWQYVRDIPKSWPVEVMGSTVLCRLMSFRHLGLFPEQLPHWAWMLERLGAVTGERPRVLNLFAYTGAASLIAARAGAEVTHVDASKKAIQWAKENQAASGLQSAPVRWILDDARKFVAREVRRGKTYHVILVDPPKFGRGPEGEVWDLFADAPPLLRDCAQLLTPERAAMVLSVYAIRASALAFDQLCRDVLAGRGGTFDSGELAIRPARGGPAVPTSLFTRWTA
ncbi:MAG: class I SAM-dependent methyltransferase [Hyphomicrobium sp.]